ncbi:MAG: hypothetical protein PHE33_04060 [Bacteroidales bacterium]|nr:hypothetical protein [Bacteroidales bacterium]
MIDTIANIEDWFLDLTPDKFPNSYDYVARYKLIRDFMNNQIHAEIKSIVAQKVPEIYLNDHGEKHIKKVIEKASEILANNFNLFSPYEIFFLLTAIQIHDAGHIINGRAEHAANAKKIINKIGNENISVIEKKYVIEIAKAHSGKEDPIGKLNEDQYVNSEKINLKRIASIVRLADELADDTTRASTFLMDNNLINDQSLIFHQYSQCLNSCIVDTKQVKMRFYINDIHLKEKMKLGEREVFLLDEIYDRTIKTFLECVYCNRFLSENNRVSLVDVRIEIDSDYEDVIPTIITYRLEEKGYPSYSKKTIFEYCVNLTNDKGQNLTGKYYNDILLLQKEKHV